MKRLIILLIVLMPCVAFSQSSKLDKLFDKYSGVEGYTSVHITKYMFDMLVNMEQVQKEQMEQKEEKEEQEMKEEKEEKEVKNELDEFKEISKNLNFIKILTTGESKAKNVNKDFIDEVKGILNNSAYKELMVVKDGKDNVIFKIKEKKNKISEFVMLVESASESVLIYMSGDIDINNISKMSKAFNMDGFKKLQNMDPKKIKKEKK